MKVTIESRRPSRKEALRAIKLGTLADKILGMVWAFPDAYRIEEVRTLALEVAELEDLAQAALDVSLNPTDARLEELHKLIRARETRLGRP